MINYDKLHERLKKEQAQITEKLELLKARELPPGERREGSPFGKREEEASEVSELEKRSALEQNLRANLAEINHALKKYEAGSYGVCDSCGQPIERGRLEALPQASLCLSCKARQAKNAKGAG